MDWPRYKDVCDHPASFTRWMLQQTQELLSDSDVTSRLLAALRTQPVERPADHSGGADTDVFVVHLSEEDAQHILGEVKQAVALARTTRGTRKRGLGGFEAAWTEYANWLVSRSAVSRTTGRITMNAEQRVMAMIDGFNRIDLDAIIECFAPDAIYHNIPMDAVQGVDAIRGVLQGFMGAATEVQWDVLNISAQDGVVLTERVDKFKVNDKWIELPVMGVFEISEDRITAWRDYFDMNQFQSQMQDAMA